MIGVDSPARVARAFLGLFACAPLLAGATAPGDPAWYTNSLALPTGFQTTPSIAASAAGVVAVTFAAPGEDGSMDVFVAWTDPDVGAAHLVTPILANVTTAGDQTAPSVAMDAVGNFVVAWLDGGTVIRFQRFARLGATLGSNVQINTIGGAANSPAIGMDAFGNFTVVWEQTEGGVSSIRLRRYAADGSAAGPESIVSSSSSSILRDPALGVGAWGQSAVAWQIDNGDATEVYARSYASDGTADSFEFPVSDPTESRLLPAIATDAHGGFVVSWTREAGAGIAARQFGAGGVPALGEFPVTFGPAQVSPNSRSSVARDVSGDFVVSWDRAADSSMGATWYRRLYSAAGSSLESGQPAFDGSAPRATMDADGDFFVAHVVNQPAGGEERTWLRALWFNGPESVDLGVTHGPVPDFVQTNSTFEYELTITNLHAASTETGIPEVDGAIGVAQFPWMSVYASGLVDVTQTCPVGSCGDIAPGATATATVTVVVAGQPGTATLSAELFPIGVDPNGANDTDSFDLAVVCQPGTEGTLEFPAGPFTVDEGHSKYVYVRRVGDNCGTVSVRFTVSGGTATVGSDFLILAYPNGDPDRIYWGPNDTEQYVAVGAIADGIDEIADEETVDVQIDSPQGGATIGTIDSATFKIADKDSKPTVMWSTTSAIEGQTATATLRLSSRSEHTITVPFTLGSPPSGAATLGVDYGPAPPSPVTFEPMSTERTLEFPTFHDLEDEYLWETIQIIPGTPTNAFSSYAGSVLILDDDPTPDVIIETLDSSMEEGGTLQIRAKLSVTTPHEVTVPIVIDANSEAVQLSTPAFTFAANYMWAYVTVTALQDPADTQSESVTLGLGTPTHATLGSDTAVVLTITEAEMTPDPFDLGARVSKPTRTEFASDLITISGLGAQVPVSITGGRYSKNGGAFTTAAGSASNGDTFRVRLFSSSDADSLSQATLTVGGYSGAFYIWTGEADTTPAAFSFADQTGGDPGTLATSSGIVVSSVNRAVPISIVGGSYRINGVGAFTDAPGTVNAGDSVRVRHRSSYESNTTTNTTLTIGGIMDTFSSTTSAKDINPAAVSFPTVFNAAQGSVTESAVLTPAGYDAPAPINPGAGTEYRINGGAYTANAGTIVPGDTLQVRHTSASAPATLRTTSVKIGTTAFTFRTKTAP